MANQLAIDAVLRLLQDQEFLPSAVLTHLIADGFAESDVKEAVVELLHDQQLIMTPDRHLKLQEAVMAV